MLDPISEMLTKIRNAQMAGQKTVTVSVSKLKMALAQILEKEGFIDAVSKEKQGGFDVIRMMLKYYTISNTNKTPAIKGIRRISKEGQRIYVKSKEVRSVKNNYGVALISTSKGVMTDHDAKKMGLGGEYICEVW
jgi:small subunit ribosomal protein S8